MARRLAAARTGDEEPSPPETRHALRQVIGKCIYGVDLNPMSVELCKVALWMEALDPGKPLSFLDHHIQCGNSLLGTTPALLAKGIPDEAFTPIEGDDRAYCSEYRKRNKQQRAGQLEAFTGTAPLPERMGDFAVAMAELGKIPDDTVAGVQQRQQRYEKLVQSSDYVDDRFLADAWCAAFVWKKRREPGLDYPITEQVYRQIERNPNAVALRLK